MKVFKRKNKNLAESMKTHLIDLDKFGVFDNDYDLFYKERCRAFSRELKKRVIPQEIDQEEQAIGAELTETDEESLIG